MTKISAFIVCLNEAHQIRRALESIRFCDEIIVVDSGSTDQTLEIAKEFTDKIFFRAWTGFVEQKTYALGLCSNEWVINIDADEVVTQPLQDEINYWIRSGKAEEAFIDGFMINRVVFHLGKWFRKGVWYPEYRLRVMRKSKTTWGGNDPHERAVVEGKTVKLKGELEHYSFESLSDHINRLNRYSSLVSAVLARKGKKASFLDIMIRPIARFIKGFFIKRGFLEGFPGFVVCVLESYYVFLKYIKLWEINRRA